MKKNADFRLKALQFGEEAGRMLDWGMDERGGVHVTYKLAAMKVIRFEMKPRQINL